MVHTQGFRELFLVGMRCGFGGMVAVSPACGAAPRGAQWGTRLVMLLQTHKQTLTWLHSPAERRAGSEGQPQHCPCWSSPPMLVPVGVFGR